MENTKEKSNNTCSKGHIALLCRNTITKNTPKGKENIYECVCLQCGMMVNVNEKDANLEKIIKTNMNLQEDFTLFFEIRQKYLYRIGCGMDNDAIIQELNAEYNNEQEDKTLKKK